MHMNNNSFAPQPISEKNWYSKEYVEAYAFLQWMKHVFGRQVYEKYGISYDSIIKTALVLLQQNKKWPQKDRFIKAVNHIKLLNNTYHARNRDWQTFKPSIPHYLSHTRWVQSLLGKVFAHIDDIEDFAQSYDPENPPVPATVMSQPQVNAHASASFSNWRPHPQAQNATPYVKNESDLSGEYSIRNANGENVRVHSLVPLDDGRYYEWTDDEWNVIYIPTDNIDNV